MYWVIIWPMTACVCDANPLEVVPVWDVTETDLVLAGGFESEELALEHAYDMEVAPASATLN